MVISELKRLQRKFEEEADRYPAINLSVIYVTQNWISRSGRFHKSNHGLPLWQYYGKINSTESINQLYNDIAMGDKKFGIAGAKYSAIAMLEGKKIDLFLRMARRAGKVFSDEEVIKIESNINSELIENDDSEGKPISVTNSNPVAIWLNFVLYHSFVSHPKRFSETIVNLDPFSESLRAIEHLLEKKTISRGKKTVSSIEKTQFKVAVSFPGEKREFVSDVIDELKNELGSNAVFYDLDYQSQLARPDLDILLQKIYRDHSDLVVVFLCEEYDEKEWCGVEWRAIRDLIKTKNSNIMFMRFDNAVVKGLLSIDGYIDLCNLSPQIAAKYILERVSINEP